MQLEKYYQSSSWQSKRQERLRIDKHQCRLCGGDGTEYRLEVHHKPQSYIRIPNESVEDDLTTLCERCHDIVTNIIREDRYEKRTLAVDFYSGSQERKNHETRKWPGYEELSVDFIVPDADAQRPISKPTESMGKGNQEDFGQAKENGSGS